MHQLFIPDLDERVNFRENRRANQEWTIQRHWAHKTQDEDKQYTKTQHTPENKNMSNMDPTKTGDASRFSQRVCCSCLLQDTRHVTQIVKTCLTPLCANKEK